MFGLKKALVAALPLAGATVVFNESEPVTWNEARERCRERHAGLASLRSLSAREWSARTTDSWVGAAWNAHYLEYVWLADGERVDESAMTSELVSSQGECLAKRRDDGALFRDECTSLKVYACDDAEAASFEEAFDDAELECAQRACFDTTASSCWEACSSRLDAASPLAAAFFLVPQRCCCLYGCCDTDFLATRTVATLRDGLVGSCVVIADETWPDDGGNNLRALAIFIIATSLFCLTALVVLGRRACGYAFLPPPEFAPSTATPAAENAGVHRDLAVEARHTLRLIVADGVQDVPLGKIVEGDGRDERKDDDDEEKGEPRPDDDDGPTRRADEEERGPAEDSRTVAPCCPAPFRCLVERRRPPRSAAAAAPSQELPTAVPAVDDAVRLDFTVPPTDSRRR